MVALQSLHTAQEVAELRGKELEDVVGKRLAEAYRAAAVAGTLPAGDGQATASNATPVGAPTPAERTP